MEGTPLNDIIATIEEIRSSMQVTLLVNPQDEKTILDALATRPDLSFVVVMTSVLTPPGKMYVMRMKGATYEGHRRND